MDSFEHKQRLIFRLGGLFTILVLIGIILDIVAGNITGGNIHSLPQTAVERFQQLQENWILGLYNLDLLNIINQLMLVPSYFAIYLVLRKENPFSLFALIIFLIGTTLFVAGNTALTMLDLSQKYYSVSSELHKNMLAAAGEAMLAKGAHGNLGVFIGFTLPTIGSLIMAISMTGSIAFSKLFSWLGVAGNTLMIVYLIFVTFIPSSGKFALVLAMPGGLLILAWMFSFMVSLFKLGSR